MGLVFECQIAAGSIGFTDYGRALRFQQVDSCLTVA
jgi:hypothetical protein